MLKDIRERPRTFSRHLGIHKRPSGCVPGRPSFLVRAIASSTVVWRNPLESGPQATKLATWTRFWRRRSYEVRERRRWDFRITSGGL